VRRKRGTWQITAGFVARVGWCAWLLTFEQGSEEGVLLRSGTGKGDEAEDERSCEHGAVGRYVNGIKRGVVDAESGSSGNFEVAHGQTYVSFTGITRSFPVAGSQQSHPAVLSVPLNTFLRL
jgi:hypothetical protein